MANRVLIVDDEPNITLSFTSLLRDEGYTCESAASAEEALKAIGSRGYALVLLDLNLPGKSGIDFLGEIKEEPDAPLVLVISGQTDIPTALEAIRRGAVDYLEKPVSPERLLSSVRSVLLLAAAQHQRNLLVDDLDVHSRIIGESKATRKLTRLITQVASSDAAVLVTGENGTGKELVAARLYLESNRRDKPYVKVNCPGVPSTLFESELFGHAKGAFTGAVKDYPGKFVLADGGTLFLDEIGDLPIDCQAKLLRVLETGEVETLGSTERRKVDVRVICATNRNLTKLISEGKFREDLYYRISVLVIDVPPLRDRLDDIPALVGEFLRRFDPGQAKTLSPEAVAYLSTLAYPGNVRQLKNIIERLTILCPRPMIGMEDVLAQLSPESAAVGRGPAGISLAESVERFERQLVEQALRDNDWNISAAARNLGVDRANFSRKVRDLGLKKA